MKNLSQDSENRKKIEDIIIQNAVESFVEGEDYSSTCYLEGYAAHGSLNLENSELTITLSADGSEMEKALSNSAKIGETTADGYLWMLDEEGASESNEEALEYEFRKKLGFCNKLSPELIEQIKKSLDAEKNGELFEEAPKCELRKNVKFNIQLSPRLKEEIQKSLDVDEKFFEITVQMPECYAGQTRSILENLLRSNNIKLVYPEDINMNYMGPVRTMLLLAKIEGIIEIVSSYYLENVAIAMNFHCPDMMDNPKK